MVAGLTLGLKLPDVVVAFDRSRDVLVAQTQVQGDSGGDTPIILKETCEPVTPGLFGRITQENRSR